MITNKNIDNKITIHKKKKKNSIMTSSKHFMPNYIHLIFFQGLVRENYKHCIDLLVGLIPYSHLLHNNKDMEALLRCFVEGMDTDTNVKKLHIIQILIENFIVGHNIFQLVHAAAISGHYNTVSVLLEYCDEDTIVALFEEIHEMKLSIAMMILRVTIWYNPTPSIVSIVGKCISNNNTEILEIIAEAFPKKYIELTGCEDCQSIIEDMKKKPLLLSSNNLLIYKYKNIKELNKYILSNLNDSSCIKIEKASMNLISYLKQFESYDNMYTPEYTVDLFVPVCDVAREKMFLCIYDWWSFLSSLI